MKISGFTWREDVVDKLWWKHQVEIEKVEQVFANSPRVKKLLKAITKVKVFMSPLGKQMQDGI